MKRILHIVLMVLTLCLSGCQGIHWFDRHPEALDYIDSLLDESNYRLAYNVVFAIDSQMLEENHGARMRFELQKIKVTDKIGKPLLTDSIILPIIDYYEHDGDKSKLPEAYYYAGRTYYSLHDYTRSMEYFNKSLDVVKEDDDYLLSRIHSQKGYLLHDQGLYDEAIKNHQKSCDYSVHINDTISMINSYRDIGNCYFGKSTFKDAMYYYDKGEELALLANNKSMMALIGIEKARAFNYMNENELAEKYLAQSVNWVDTLHIDHANSVVGYIYFRERKYDLAKLYFEKLLNSNSLYARQQGEAMLLSMAANDKNFEEALKHLVPYKKLTDSVSFITNAEQIARINGLYSTHKLEIQNEELEKVNMRNTYYIIIGGLFLLTVIATLMVYSYRIRAERNRLRYNNALLDQYLQEEQRKRSQAEQERDKLAETDVMERLKQEQGDRRKNTIRESAIYQKLLNTTKALSQKDQIEAEELLSQVYPDFFIRLQSLGIIKEQELKVCLLLKMGFIPSRIASLVSLTLSAITNIRKRMYGKVTGKSGKAEDWDKIVDNL